MNRGLLLKGLRELWLVTLLCGLGAALFEGLLTPIFWSYQEQFTDQVRSMEFVRQLIEGLVGAELGEAIGFSALASLAWTHPIFLAILCAHVIATCTRMPAGEIDRGTIDVLFGMPLSRATIYATESALWLGGGVIVIALAATGSAIGYAFVPAEGRPDAGGLVLVLLNLYALYAAVGGFALWVSSLSDRRGRAVGVAFGVLLFNFVWNFLGQYWSVAERLSWLSVLNFFRPLPMLDDGTVPAANLAVLVTLALVLWFAGAVTFVRRDIHTV